MSFSIMTSDNENAAQSDRPQRAVGLLAANAAIVVIAGLFILAVVAMLLVRRHERLERGDRVAQLELIDLNGRSRVVHSTSSASHVWLIVRPSCPICVRELHVIDPLLAQYAVSDITVLSLGTRDETDRMTANLAAVRARTLIDDHGGIDAALGRFRVPTMLILDASGRINSKVVGQPADLETVLRAGLGRRV